VAAPPSGAGSVGVGFSQRALEIGVGKTDLGPIRLAKQRQRHATSAGRIGMPADFRRDGPLEEALQRFATLG
jgi:hypothetical protein